MVLNILLALKMMVLPQMSGYIKYFDNSEKTVF